MRDDLSACTTTKIDPLVLNSMLVLRGLFLALFLAEIRRSALYAGQCSGGHLDVITINDMLLWRIESPSIIIKS
jgi:hypothetical protein